MLALAAALAVQDAGRIAQEVEYANSKDRPQLQAQAVRRLLERGGPAVAEALVEFVRRNGRNALSLACTEALGELKDPRIAALLRELAADPDFYWRPAAMKALAEHADPADRELFRRGLGDRLWGCRVGAIRGVERLGDRASMERLRELLGDEVYDVRAQAARSLYAMGDPSGLPVLVEALRADAVWFDIDYGQIAREDAWNFLKKAAGDDFGYKPWDPPDRRAAGLAKFEAWVARTYPDWRERVPEKARARADRVEYVFGYELRSCQKGDFFFRIDASGNFVVGYFTLEKAPLSAEERRAFEEALEKVRRVDRSIPYGQGGCDFEQYYLREGNRFEKLWVGTGGRPAAAEPFIEVVGRIVRAKFGERAGKDFEERAALFRGGRDE
ncbi:MAG TPA: HEAT repeat domain-containing protein [Planctomycetota bacterium]|nr:HEAT repeat domain-containing protein [Planctomycetota bacterium]